MIARAFKNVRLSDEIWIQRSNWRRAARFADELRACTLLGENFADQTVLSIKGPKTNFQFLQLPEDSKWRPWHSHLTSRPWLVRKVSKAKSLMQRTVPVL
jgi:hypothetical protein